MKNKDQKKVEAGLLKKRNGRMYDLRVHSIRKFFKTQMLAFGMQPDYVDYMMGTQSTPTTTFRASE
jgi:intergrase/recombinase